jgi:cytochrome c oxidase subunit 1
VACQVLAMFTFTFGGIGGLINGSANLDLLVHNTAWISGHLHLTVGTAATLTYMGITYWLVPVLWGRKLWSRWMALAQAWTWAFGMLIFSHSLHAAGLLGMPRRTMISQAPYIQPGWEHYMKMTGIGGSILFVSGLLYLLNMALTMTVAKRVEQAPPEFAEAVSGAEEAPGFLDNFSVWVPASVALIVIAYGPTLYRLLTTITYDSPGLRVW